MRIEMLGGTYLGNALSESSSPIIIWSRTIKGSIIAFSLRLTSSRLQLCKSRERLGGLLNYYYRKAAWKCSFWILRDKIEYSDFLTIVGKDGDSISGSRIALYSFAVNQQFSSELYSGWSLAGLHFRDS